MSLLAELKRRNVVRAIAAYVAVAWLLIQVAEATFPAFGLSERALRLLIIGLAIGMAPATALAWAFELTPEGFKRERDLDRSGPLATRTNRLLDRAIVVLLALGLTYFAVDKFFLSPAREQARVDAAIEHAIEHDRGATLEQRRTEKSIVVLPCTNLSSDPEQAFVADGMAEELLNLLARIPELRVISRTSAFAFKGKDAGVAEIAGRLKVSHVLECSVRRSGDRLRITAQLIEASTDSHLWSETYDRTLDDVFAIQDDIAARVVDALKLELLGEAPKSRSSNPQAYMLFMQARQLDDAWIPDAERVHALLTRALEIDPQFADAWTELARLYYRCSVGAYGEESDEVCRKWPKDKAWRLSEQARMNALSIDPDNAVAIAYGAWLKAFQEKDWAGAAPGFERALALDPTKPDVLRAAAQYAAYIRRPDVAVRLGEFAVARDPLCTQCLYQLARYYWDAGRLDDAEKAMRTFATTERGGWHSIALLRLAQGDAEGAMATLERLPDGSEDERLEVRSMALYSLGRDEESRAALRKLEETSAESYDLTSEAYAWRGEFDRALTVLEDASSRRKPKVWPIDWTRPLLRPLFETERGQAVLRRFGVADDQLAAISFEVRLPGEPAEPVDRR